MTPSTVEAYAVFAAVLAAGLLAEYVAHTRCKRRIVEWASSNRYQLLQISRRWLSLQAGRTRRVFKVTLSDSSGHIRTATFIVGGGIGGIAADDYEVNWS